MKGKSTAVARPAALAHQIRIGEDWVPVTAKHDKSIDLDLRGAAVPAKQYTSDVGGIVSKPRMVQLQFGQSRVDGELRNLIVISMPIDSMRSLLKSFDVLREVRKSLVAQGVEIEDLAKIRNEPSTTVGMTATIAYVGVGGYDTCMDFYYHAPMAFEKAVVLNKLAVVPIVRVNLPTELFFALWDALVALEPQWPKLVKEVEP